MAVTASFDIAEAEARLPEILELGEGGREVYLTRRGKPVARVGPDRDEPGRRQLGWARGQINFFPTSTSFGVITARFHHGLPGPYGKHDAHHPGSGVRRYFVRPYTLAKA